MTDLGFVHRYVPGTDAHAPTLLLLHGTGGDENDLLPLGRALAEGAAMLSPRGNVLEGGAPRVFRRLADGVFDQEDLALRTEELARFIEEAVGVYGIDRANLIAVGFSNGANIAASLIFRRPSAVPRAALFSPMIPFEPADPVDLSDHAVFIGAGRRDPIAPASQAEGLAEMFRTAGADVTVHWHEDGHTITEEVFAAAREWIRP